MRSICRYGQALLMVMLGHAPRPGYQGHPLIGQFALRIVELERAEQASRDALIEHVEPEQIVVDGLTGIPLTAQLMSQLPNHFSPSEIQALLGRAVVQEGTQEVNQTLKRVNACERYLKRSANQMTRFLRQLMGD